MVTVGLLGWTCAFTGVLYQVGYLDYLGRKYAIDPRDPRRVAEEQMREERKTEMMRGFLGKGVSASRVYETMGAREKRANTEGMKKLFTSEGFDGTKMEAGLYGDVVVSKSERLKTAAAIETEKASAKTA